MKIKWNKANKAAEKSGRFLLNLLYPRRCPVCDDVIPMRRGLICPQCLDRVRMVKEPVCLRCGKEIAAQEAEYCYDCSRHERSFVRGYAMAVYDRTMRESLSRFKNGGRMDYADWYAQALWEKFGAELKAARADCLVPVPVHRSRLGRRGYNQAELVARRLGKKLELPVLSRALVRGRNTRAQKFLGGGERGRNLEGAFRAGRQPVAGMGVILLDDIYTTGATAQTCTRSLLAAGAREVRLVCICIGENDE